MEILIEDINKTQADISEETKRIMEEKENRLDLDNLIKIVRESGSHAEISYFLSIRIRRNFKKIVKALSEANSTGEQVAINITPIGEIIILPGEAPNGTITVVDEIGTPINAKSALARYNIIDTLVKLYKDAVDQILKDD